QGEGGRFGDDVETQVVQREAEGIVVEDGKTGDVAEASVAAEGVRAVRQVVQDDPVDQAAVTPEEAEEGRPPVGFHDVEAKLGLVDVEQAGDRTLAEGVEPRKSQ